ncbi:deoxyguanosinetriphosphate triphosphohydrolase [Fodinicurvata fenggangensis]|uniref:deoxyguanosinetriphosphate triphosphohydrolase n=1 Tax=Fodinicurvata fenggangensis TaxID=1121830 RepID=UPI00047C5D52|nr:deoxyguanosinetriphosphate triphosphohydrolase [Fodinicurvata fenggangensis]
MMNPATFAPYACVPDRTRGRKLPEEESRTRSVFQRDRDRIIHSGAFRKLQYKTQVFVYHEGDYYRTRLTHSVEVAQIARSIARQLQLNEDLAEAVALAHDLGHTPFGHAGEDALKEAMEGQGGFDHNEQTFRILTLLEERYAAFNGLNLTWETLEGVAKHNGPVSNPRESLESFCREFDLELGSYASLEAQVAALADDIAYVNHDLADGLRAQLFTIDDLLDLPLLGDLFNQVGQAYPGVDEGRLVHEVIRRLIDLMVNDLLQETNRHLEESSPGSADAVRAQSGPLVAFSDEMRMDIETLRSFLFQRMYRHYQVNRITSKARRVLKQLFQVYLDEPNCLPHDWQSKLDMSGSEDQRARIVADYVAGMTDRYALESHETLFNPYIRL